MKRKSNLILFVCITFAIIMLSISTTLALVQDEESKVGNIIKFDKVAIMGDVEGGSKLSINIEDRNVGNTIEVIGENFGGEELYIKPAEQTREMYIRCRVYFTFGDEELDAANELALKSFIAEDGFPKGFEIYSNDAIDYKFVKSNGWAYLVTKDSEDLLKVVTQEEHDEKFILCNKYIMGLDLQYETQIINVIETNNLGYLQMKVEAQAIQAYGLANLTVEEGNEILSSGTETLEEKFGNAKIAHYEVAINENAEFVSSSGLPTKSNTPFNEWTWEEIKVASTLIEKAYESGALKLVSKPIQGTTNPVIYYDEITREKPLIMIDNVRVNYYTVGTYGQSNYDRVFTFNEKGIVNEIHLRDEKIIFLKTNACKVGIYSMKATETNIIMQVADFLHDNKTTGGKAGISLISKNVINNFDLPHWSSCNYDGKYGYHYGAYGGTWENHIKYFLRTECLRALKAQLPSNVSIIKSVKKTSIYCGTSYDYWSKTYTDDLWIMSVSEAFRDKCLKDGRWFPEEGKWYPIYVNNTDRVKTNLNDQYGYALRTCRPTYGRTTYAYYIKADGSPGEDNDKTTAYSHKRISFGFCV